jgi:hypothetical protein
MRRCLQMYLHSLSSNKSRKPAAVMGLKLVARVVVKV